MHRLALTGLLPVVFAALSGAQNPPVLTEAEFLSVLDGAHPAVRERSESVAGAEANLRGAATLENPVFGVVREDPSGPQQQTEVQISWQLPDAARRARIATREKEVEAARAHFTQNFLQDRLAMRQAYADWAIADDRRQRLAVQAQRVQALVEREEARSEKGEVSGLEAHRLRLAASVLRSSLALASAAGQRARAEVATWYPRLPVDVRPILPALQAIPSLDGTNAQIRAAEADLAATELAKEAARRFISSPEISLGWQRQDVGSESFEGPIFGLAWSVPVFDRKQATQNAAEARHQAAQARLELVQHEVNASRSAARNSFAHLSGALLRARQDLAISQRMLDGAEAAFRHGEAGLTDLLETHRAVTEAELAMLDLYAAALAAHRELERLAAAGGAALTIENQPSNSLRQENIP